MMWMIGSKNVHKLHEIKALCSFPVDLVTVPDYVEAPEETGTSLLENAQIKARWYYQQTNTTTIADDTGLFVECLGGLPGVYSARFNDLDPTYSGNRRKLLELLTVYSQPWRAYFETCIVITGDGWEWAGSGRVEGEIIASERGDNGFGYDSIFVPNYSLVTFAEMTDEMKNRHSHRYLAFQKVIDAYTIGILH